MHLNDALQLNVLYMSEWLCFLNRWYEKEVGCASLELFAVLTSHANPGCCSCTCAAHACTLWSRTVALTCSAAWLKSRSSSRLNLLKTVFLLLLSTAVVPPLTSVPLFLCVPPSPVRLHRSLPLIGSVQAGGLACPAEPNSAACRLRGMYSTAALPSLTLSI